MRSVSTALFVLAIVIAGGYYYRFAESKCAVPVAYDIGTVDSRFDITKEEIRAAISDAESLWEDSTGENLFTYTPGSDFTVNFVYDERQELTNEEESARVALDEKEIKNETIREQYKDLAARYESLKRSYESRVTAYEERLADHNEEVEEWNKKGGAPKEEFEKLNKRQSQLAKERDELNGTAAELNRLITGLNKLGESGNDAVKDYNDDVAWYNSFFGKGEEFTQGDYQGDNINIYQFDDPGELRRVLAHELGHALSLEHVEGGTSIMYYFMEGKLSNLTLSDADLAEFRRVCGGE